MDRTRTKVQNYDSTVSESVSIWQIICARIITENPANAILLHLLKNPYELLQTIQLYYI